MELCITKHMQTAFIYYIHSTNIIEWLSNIMSLSLKQTTKGSYQGDQENT
uniref:Uncharacterized protein n=1 Tax=Arion vulgaris TaxID=1028688 RepID=A0A0B7A430_9EUPU